MANPHFQNPPLNSGLDAPRKWFKEMPLHADPDWIVLWDDFTGIALDSTNDWTVIQDTGNTTAIEADTVGGRVLITTDGTDDEGGSLQANEIFAVVDGKRIWFETKLQVSDATQTQVTVGLTVNFATNPEAILTAADRIVFEKDDGTAAWQAITEEGGTETATASVGTLVDATDQTLGILVTGTGAGTGKVEFFVDRALVATHTANITSEEMTPAVFILAGEAAAKTMSVDYILTAADR